MSYVNKEQIERAKRLDLLTYLQMCEPAELVRCSRNVYTTRTHDSLKISNGKWYWWSRGIGGRSALDYLIKVRGLSFSDAVLQIDGVDSGSAPTFSQSLRQRSSSARFELPEPNRTSHRVMAYLSKRGIHRTLIDYCLETGRLYESQRHHNAVFVGFDQKGRRAMRRYAGRQVPVTWGKPLAATSGIHFRFRLWKTVRNCICLRALLICYLIAHWNISPAAIGGRRISCRWLEYTGPRQMGRTLLPHLP